GGGPAALPGRGPAGDAAALPGALQQPARSGLRPVHDPGRPRAARLLRPRGRPMNPQTEPQTCRITVWKPGAAITAYPTLRGETPPALYSGWVNHVSQRAVRAVAVGRLLWAATWGGAASWDRRQGDVYQRYTAEHGLSGNAVACLCL